MIVMAAPYYDLSFSSLIKAEGLDVAGNDVNEILDAAKKQIDNL